METTQNGVTYSDFAVTGGGGYIGVSITFKKAFYFLIAGTVPAYIGGSASGKLIGNMGATRKSNSIVSLSSMKDKQLNVDGALQFNGNLNASASVALFAGVGLSDILGIRVQGQADLGLLWEPLAKQTYAMNDEADEIIDGDYSNAKIHEVGFTVVFSLGGQIDLLLFTIPVMHKFDPISTGFNKDIQNAHVRKTPPNETIDVDGASKPTSSVGHITDGWYCIKSVSNGRYLQVKNGKVSLVSKMLNENANMRFYISKSGNSYVTIKAYEDNSDSKSKYLMFNANDKNKLASSEVIANDATEACHKFMLREPNIGDFNIISATNGGELYLRSTSENGLVFEKSENTNLQLWRLEPVNEPVTNGTYTIKNNSLNKYLTDVNGKAEVGEEIKSNSQKWYVSANDDYISLKNLATGNYLYVDSDSGNDGISISVKADDNSNGVYFATSKLIDGSYNITTRYSIGKKLLSVYGGGNGVVTNSANDTYNQAWTFAPVENEPQGGTTPKAKQMVSSEGVSMFSADEDIDSIPVSAFSDETDYNNNVMLRKRTTGDSEWVASENDEVSAYSGFKPINERTLVKNSYERPDSQVADLGDGNYMLAFIDTDSSRGELERTVLKYAFYKNGAWSQPVVVQNDGTADFQPNVADAGDDIAITWISSDPDTEKTGDPTQYLTTMEVYTTLVNKATGEIGEITRLTKDSYYDYAPTVVYDSTTGDMAVYYIKSSVGSSFLETANSFTNDCIITYMLYDSNMCKWLTDYYYPEEVSDESAAEELIKNWGGQRFLPSPIDELGMSDPLITDFTAIGYNGLAVYGYTIDKDNDSSTNEDRDLFVQVYDFTTHKNHLPIRITNDGTYDDEDFMSDVADSMPQFVRAGGADGSTYLYWFRGDNKLSYINISEMAHNGLNDDGTVSDTDLIAPRDVYINLPPEMKQGSNEAFATMSYYKVCVDKDDNIYVIWVDLDRETNKQEIFATAVVTDKESGETSYADAYQLTKSGRHNDEPAFLVDDNGNMIVVSTRYTSAQTNDPLNPLEIKDTELVATVFEPFGELYAEDINVSDTVPEMGETVTVNSKLYNRGLTVAKGYSVELCLMNGEQVVKTINTLQSSDYVNAGDYAEFKYDWAVDCNVDGLSLGLVVTEGEMNNSSVAQSEVFRLSPDIALEGIGITQKDDGFYLHAVATNNGNFATADSDSVNVVYYPEKAKASMLGIEDETFVKTAIGVIAPKESKEFEIKIDNINGEMFNAYGYLPVLVAVTNANDEVISNAETDYIIMDKPIDLKVNNTRQIVINEGEAIDLTMTYAPEERYSNVTPNYYTEDNSIATVIDNQLVGVAGGITKLIAVAEPYNAVTEIEVIVNSVNIKPETTTESTTSANRGNGGGNSSSKASAKAETTTEATTENTANSNADKFTDISNHWAREVINSIAGKNIVNGYADGTFKPDNSITRAEFLTMLYNTGLADTSVKGDVTFADVTGNEWYYDYISWGAENNLIVGYEDNTFRGNDVISRQEMAVVVSKFVKLANIKFTDGEAIVFADNAAIASWAKQYVDDISAYGIVMGDNNNCYLPDKNLTRAETAVIIDKVMQ